MPEAMLIYFSKKHSLLVTTGTVAATTGLIWLLSCTVVPADKLVADQ